MQKSLLRRLAADRHGNFAVMAALSAPVALALAAVAIDGGSLYTERREVQALADLAAIAGAANVANADAAVLATLKANGASVAMVSGASADPAGGKVSAAVVPGRYSADAAIEAGRRFEAGRQPYNAVQVTLRRKGRLFFGGAFMQPPTIAAKAVAAATPQATFSIGSRLLKIDTADSPLLNSLLGGLLGTNVALSAMDYNALLNADVGVLDFLDQMAVKLNLTGVNYSEVLASKASIGQIAGAMANVPGLDSRSRLALQGTAAGATGAVKVPLEHLVDLGPMGRLGLGQRSPGLAVDAKALALLSAAATLANGARQVSVDTGINLPGLLDIKLSLAVGEPPQSSPWLTVGEKGAIVRTAQTRLKLVANIGSSTVQPGIKLLSVSIPLNVEVAYAEAQLKDISCTTGRPESRKVTIAARPGIAEVYLAQNDSSNFADFTRKESFSDASLAKASINLLLVNIPLLELRAMAHARMGDTTTTDLVFNEADIEARRPKTVTARDYTQSLTSSLVKNLELTPYVLGARIGLLDIALKPLQSAVLPLLDSLTSQLDPILFKLLSALGIGLGQADVRVTDATCGRSVLVQ
ncbi:TadG family pilus assembly protein [Mesorhizobium sp. SP-1A]|uniref:TadG family pilus assembly protein n=1 Tax=Mesorhizobium sp. SP-1A TaxID=3077840 RepID=UPI0028F74B5D|nr:TadG family pilus assembly protein [Mesorhizobium sp. SP-1A]